jgi:hypothetical protein
MSNVEIRFGAGSKLLKALLLEAAGGWLLCMVCWKRVPGCAQT